MRFPGNPAIATGWNVWFAGRNLKMYWLRQIGRPLGLSAFVLIGAALGHHAEAQSTSPSLQPTTAETPQPAPTATPAERARGVLERHCARCHQGSAEAPAQSAFANILAVDDLAHDASLVQPGRPDASRLYNVLLAGHVPQQVFDAANPAPAADDIDQVRDWIERLDRTPPPQCPSRRRVTLADQGATLEKLRGPGGEALKGIRFISLAAYHNACATDAEMEARRRAVSALVTALRTTLVEFDLPVAADGMPILAVRLGDMGWDPSQWDALAAQARAAHLTDPALAAAYGTETPLMDVRDLAAAARVSGAYPKLATAGRTVAQFVREGASSVDLAQAAIELGSDPDAILEKLTTLQGVPEGAALALRQSMISAEAWRELRPALTARSPLGPLRYLDTAAPNPAGIPLGVAIWTDKLTYRKDELVVLTAQANKDCNLTVINVDTAGEATVLYPSDSDPDNAVKAQAKIRVPSDIEPYQLRATERGTETFIAVCTLNRKRMLGVDQNFEKQRFSILGNWRSFLKTAATRETLIGRSDTPRQRRNRVKAAAAQAAAAQAAAITQPEQEARSAIYVKIE